MNEGDLGVIVSTCVAGEGVTRLKEDLCQLGWFIAYLPQVLVAGEARQGEFRAVVDALVTIAMATPNTPQLASEHLLLLPLSALPLPTFSHL
jgi:hypothetical protein